MGDILIGRGPRTLRDELPTAWETAHGAGRITAEGDRTMERALVLLSGGLDSAVALWWADKKGWEVSALTFNYHLRPKAELRACQELLSEIGLRAATEIEMPFLREVSDLGGLMGNSSLVGAPEGYIPARNLVFYAVALNQAEVIGARYVIGGHNSGDSHVFPDASPRFFSAINDLARVGLWSAGSSSVEVLIPLSGLTKEEVLRLGLKLGVPFEHTWSCYGDGPLHCGVCESCRERRQAFQNLGLVDPVRYGRHPPSAEEEAVSSHGSILQKSLGTRP